MPLRALTFTEPGLGTLWLSSMPGRFETWQDFLAESRRAGLSLVVCLAPADEVAALSPLYWRAIAEGSVPFRWLNLPMQNFGLPADMDDFRQGMAQAAASLRGGESVMLHCAAGIGRTGTAAACLLKCLGLPVEEAVQRVRDAGSNPETALQSGLVDRF